MYSIYRSISLAHALARALSLSLSGRRALGAAQPNRTERASAAAVSAEPRAVRRRVLAQRTCIHPPANRCVLSSADSSIAYGSFLYTIYSKLLSSFILNVLSKTCFIFLINLCYLS